MPSSLLSTAHRRAVGPGLGHRLADVRRRWRRASAAPAGRAAARTPPARPRRRPSAAAATGSVEPGEHRRPAHGGGRHAGRDRDRLEHQPVERALAQLAGDQAAQVGLLVGGGPRRTGRRSASARRACEPAPATSADLLEGVVHLGDGQAGAGRPARAARSRLRQPRPVRRCRSTPERYDVAVSTSSGRGRRQGVRERGDLGLAGPGRRRRPREACDQVGEQHGAHCRRAHRRTPVRRGEHRRRGGRAGVAPGVALPVGTTLLDPAQGRPATRRSASTPTAPSGAASAPPRAPRPCGCGPGRADGEVHADRLGRRARTGRWTSVPGDARRRRRPERLRAHATRCSPTRTAAARTGGCAAPAW